MTNADTVLIEWDAKFELGIPVIDAQHKKLLSLCNSLYGDLMRIQSGGAADWHDSLKGALHECADYVFVHFRDEERLMQAAAYTNFTAHKQQHDIFIKKILETVRRFNSITVSETLQFVRFLYEWILVHIAHEDKQYVQQILDYYRKTRQ